MDFAKYWHAFLHWSGWRKFATGCAAAWNALIGWSGWKTLFSLPVWAIAVLCVLCAAGLLWVFLSGNGQTVPAYVLYALSFYGLTAACGKLPEGFRRGKLWICRHPRIAGILQNKEFHFVQQLYVDQFFNFAYGIFKIVSGIVLGSAWIGCDGIYNLSQAGIQLFQILRRKNPGTLVQQWQSYRLCGVLILLMHPTLTGIVFQMVNWNRAEEQGMILVIATATFAFYRFISSFIHIAKDRKHTRPIDSSVRMLKLSQAIFAIFSLQASMLHTFGTGESWEHWLNTAAGCTVCLLIVAMGIYMIRRGTREIKQGQEAENE